VYIYAETHCKPTNKKSFPRKKLVHSPQTKSILGSVSASFGCRGNNLKFKRKKKKKKKGTETAKQSCIPPVIDFDFDACFQCMWPKITPAIHDRLYIILNFVGVVHRINFIPLYMSGIYNVRFQTSIKQVCIAF
jgi:hypothetical protein